MNVTDLRSALRDRAADVDHHYATERVVEVHTRVRRVRRRRIATAGVFAAVALVLVGAATALPGRGAEPDRTRPAQAPTDKGFLRHSGSFDLLTAEVGRLGQSRLDVTLSQSPHELLIDAVCHRPGGPAGGYWVSAWVGDTMPDRPQSTRCGRDRGTPADPGPRGDAPGPWQYEPRLTVPRFDPVTVHVALTRVLDQNGVPVDDPDDTGTHVLAQDPRATLSVGVYSIAEPVHKILATEIRPLVGLNGQDYAYLEAREAKPGEHQLTWRLDPAGEERYFDVAAANLAPSTAADPGTTVSVGVDGDHCRIDYTLPRLRVGGCVLAPGRPHTITATMSGDVPQYAVVGIVLYGKK